MPNFTSDQERQIREFINANQVIYAIKVYREKPLELDLPKPSLLSKRVTGLGCLSRLCCSCLS